MDDWAVCCSFGGSGITCYLGGLRGVILRFGLWLDIVFLLGLWY